MTYLELKRAAKKHYITCKCLFDKCNNSWIIQENIYYLCGYIVEMMIKYQFFRRINYSINENIENLNYNGLTYKKDIKTHNIISLVNLLRKYDGDIILNDVLNLFRKWDVDIRYNGKRKIYDNLKESIELSKKLIEKFGEIIC
jgi:hypothetical protein